MNKQERKTYMKSWNEAHKEQRKAYKKAYYQANKEQILARYQANKEHYKEYRQENKEKINAAAKAWHAANKEQYNAYKKAYAKNEVNSLGQTKNSIRLKSRQILKQMNLNIHGYEIHHCFGYEDPSKFIYISKSLHLKIHQFLRDNNIDAGSDHWTAIRDIVNSADEFMYIKC